MSAKDKMERGYRALIDMPPGTKTAAEAIEQALKRQTRGVTLIRFKIGKMVNDVQWYDTKSVVRIADYLGIKPDMLFDAADFAKAFTIEALEQLLQTMPVNVGLHHYMEIGRAGGRRQFLLTEIARDNWSLSYLKNHIEESGLRPHRTKGRRRKPVRPKNPLAGVVQIRSIMQLVRAHEEIWESAVLAELEQMPADEVNPVYVKQLEDARNEAVAAGKMMMDLASRVDSILASVKQNQRGGKV